jgi:hypothetical protein
MSIAPVVIRIVTAPDLEVVVGLAVVPVTGDYLEALGKTWLVTRRLVREGDVKVWLAEVEGQ